MRKLLNNRWFVATMALLAAALVWSSLRSPSNNAAAPTPAGYSQASSPDSEQPQATGDAAVSSTREALNKLTIQKVHRDPFASRTVVETSAAPEINNVPDLVETASLSAIWSQNGNTLLLVNDRISHVGDTLGRLTIESADNGGIWLTHAKGRTYLPVGKSFVLKTPVRKPVRTANP
jgi:hypothetical protein